MTYYSAFAPSIDDSDCDLVSRPIKSTKLLDNHFELAALRSLLNSNDRKPVDLVITQNLNRHKILARAPQALKKIELAGTV
ncbi:hypothetical protein OAS46_01770 [Alphaproteobacteria bacterium]|nr:hypothetical protein [Alphaproteobacteria bacterium]